LPGQVRRAAAGKAWTEIRRAVRRPPTGGRRRGGAQPQKCCPKQV